MLFRSVDRLLGVQTEMSLTGDGEAVRLVQLGGVGIESAGGCEVSQMEGLSEEIEPVAEHVEGAARFQSEGEFGEEGFIGVCGVVVGDYLPGFGLGGLDEVENGVWDAGRWRGRRGPGRLFRSRRR